MLNVIICKIPREGVIPTKDHRFLPFRRLTSLISLIGSLRLRHQKRATLSLFKNTLLQMQKSPFVAEFVAESEE